MHRRRVADLSVSAPIFAAMHAVWDRYCTYARVAACAVPSVRDELASPRCPFPPARRAQLQLSTSW
eukprot:COSAG02_NODE_152_length_33208_cov_13.316591_14_plen_66_part_00